MPAFGATAQASEAAMNRAMPAMKVLRRPNRSPAAPPTRISADKSQRIGVRNPLCVDQAGAEIGADRRNGDREDRAIDKAERRGQDRRSQDEFAPLLRTECARGGGCRAGGDVKTWLVHRHRAEVGLRPTRGNRWTERHSPSGPTIGHRKRAITPSRRCSSAIAAPARSPAARSETRCRAVDDGLRSGQRR